jgi:ATP-binding cassette subfamily C (CFTR/MRP) protein 10
MELYITEECVTRSIWFNWFTKTLYTGHLSRLNLNDLYHLPNTMKAAVLSLPELLRSTSTVKLDTSESEKLQILLQIISKHHFSAFIILGLLKLGCTLISFGGPLILGYLVNFVNYPTPRSDLNRVFDGLLLVISLTLCLLLSAILNTAYNMRGNILQMKLKSIFTLLLYHRVTSLKLHHWSELGLNEARLSTMVQVDAECVASCVKSLHDLWALPCQLTLAFIFLYLQVRIGFLAGLGIILIMIPINTKIASLINSATAKMMTHKDKRLAVVTEAVRGMKAIKMLNLESYFMLKSENERNLEWNWLFRRKFLDALCVFLWASLPVIVPAVTFIATILWGDDLSAAKVNYFFSR